MMTEKKFRPNVAGIILNDKDEILLIRRKGTRDEHWQLPQGGIDAGETPEEAVYRELREEIGTDNFATLHVLPDFHRYEFPKGHPRYDYDGQSQTIFFLRFLGNDTDIKLDDREASDWKWYTKKEALRTIHRLRRPSFEKALQKFFK